MKDIKIIIMLIVTTVLFVTACDKDFLDEKPRSFYAPENTFISTSGFETAMTGLLFLTRDEITLGTSSVLWNGTDMARVGGDSDFLEIRDLGPNMDSNFEPGQETWEASYVVISHANLILANVNNENVDWSLPKDKARIEAQAKFIRAYYYEYMTTIFGDIPFVTEPLTEVRLDFTRDPVATIQTYIIADLEDAIPNLPDADEVDKEGSITKGAAQYLLTQIYLHAGMDAKAETTAKAIISSGKYNLVDDRFGAYTSDPGDAYSDLFLENNQNRSSGNKESIWVLQMQYNVDGGSSKKSYYRQWWVPRYEKINGMVLCDSLGGRGKGRVIPLQWMLDSYEAQDMRNSKFNIKRQYWYNNIDHVDYGKKLDMNDPDRDDYKMFASTTKWNYSVIKYDGHPSYKPMDKDLMFYRFSGVYLMLAEAQFKQGNAPDAATNLNKVRSRANATDVEPGDIDLDYILDEYAREFLAGFPSRRYTLLRTGQLAHRLQRHRLEDIWPNFQVGRDELWPIPQEVIDANLDAVLEQNPGYD